MSKLWENIFRLRERQMDAIDDILLRIPIFQDLKRQELRTIKRILHQREYQKNEVIFNEGDVGLGMYIIMEGGVEIVCEPNKHQLADLSVGDFFGELALLDEAPRSASAITKSPSRILCFFKPELLDLIERNPRLGSKILMKLAWTIGERLKRTNEQVRELMCLKQQESPDA